METRPSVLQDPQIPQKTLKFAVSGFLFAELVLKEKKKWKRGKPENRTMAMVIYHLSSASNARVPVAQLISRSI